MEDTILSLENGAMERWRKGDPWGWAEISAEDVTYFDPNLTKPIVGLRVQGVSETSRRQDILPGF